MENNITIFENAEFGKVCTLEINNEPWFVGKGSSRNSWIYKYE